MYLPCHSPMNDTPAAPGASYNADQQRIAVLFHIPDIDPAC